MKIYKVSATGHPNEWVSSQAETAHARKDLMAKGLKRAQITTEQVDIPTKKEELLVWLNKNWTE